MAPELTVQVVNYDTADYLRPCLDSLLAALAATPVTARIAVLDNGSSDDLSGLAHELDGVVDFLVSEDNRGFGGGHNLLAATNASPLICCVNPDVVATRPDVLARLIGVMEDTSVVAAGPRLLTPAGTPQRFDHGELRGLRAAVANAAGHAHWRPRTDRADVAWVSGAFLLLRRSAFAAVGGFDEAFFLYKEEEDLCLRLRRAGGRVVYAGDAEAQHVGSVVARRDPALLGASVARYQAKHFPGSRRRVLDALYRHVTRRI